MTDIDTEEDEQSRTTSMSAARFRQGFQYTVGASSTAKQIFSKTHETFAAKENDHENDSHLDTVKRRLKAKLKRKTLRSKDDKVKQVQADFLDGNLASTQAMVQKMTSATKGKGLKLPKEYKGLLSSLGQMKTALQDLKTQSTAASVPIAPADDSTVSAATHIKPMRTRPSLDEEEKMTKLLRNRRKREKKKAKQREETETKEKA